MTAAPNCPHCGAAPIFRAATVPIDHPLAQGLRTSQKALDEIERQKQANIAGYMALRDFPVGSSADPHPLGQEYDGDALREALDGLEWTEDGYSLRTPYDGDADGDGRSIIVGGETVLTFDDSDVADTYRIRFIDAISATPPAQEGEGA